tara:strand:+ start:20 stop:661 length:642 start_codon:yes stop_codon:yes gene_type:complete
LIFSENTFGVYVPEPPDHVIEVALPPKTADTGTAELSQVPVDVPSIFIVAASLKDNSISSKDDSHGPAGSSEVRVKITIPAFKSAALGVYAAFKLDASSNEPVPFEVQVAELAEPPIDPDKVYESSEHRIASIPASTSTVSIKLIMIFSAMLKQGPVPSGSATDAVTIASFTEFSALVGVYVGDKLLIFGAKEPPAALDQMIPRAEPPITEDN